MININDIKPGLKIIGLWVEIDNVLTASLFTWGTPWEITRVEYYFSSEPHEWQGVMVPARKHYTITAKSFEGIEQAVANLSDVEGVICL